MQYLGSWVLSVEVSDQCATYLTIPFLYDLKPVYERNVYQYAKADEFDLLTLSKRQILNSSKLKEFADDKFKFGENGRNVTRMMISILDRVENTVGKEEIAHYEQFLLFPQCFQKTCTADT